MGRTRSSDAWLKEHRHDGYVQAARRDGYRSRAAYKLREIDRRDQLLGSARTIVDLGAAPGGWTQYCAETLNRDHRLIAVDILPMNPLAGVTVVQADFTADEGLAAVKQALGASHSDLVLSDMAPNLSGIKAIDQPAASYLMELALAFATETLRPGGNLLVKGFQGEGFDEFLAELRAAFGQVQVRKPAASRDRSNEVYLLARRCQA